MRLIGLAVLLTLNLFAAPLAADAQPAGKVPRIGVLHINSQSSVSTLDEAFRRGLRERGYVEGQNVVIEYAMATGTWIDCPNSRLSWWRSTWI